MGILHGLIGGLRDGKPGAFSQLDGSDALERLLMQVTGSPTPADPRITMAQLPPAAPPGAAPAVPPPAAASAPALGMIGGAAKHRKANIFDYLVNGPDAGRMIEADERDAAMKQAIMTRLMGSGQPPPQQTGSPASAGPVDINSPDLPAIALAAKAAGMDLGTYLEVLKAQKAPEPKTIEGPDGIYRENPDHSYKRVQPYAAPTPFGWELGPDGNPRPRRGGPADPDYIGRTTGARRDAVVARPMPRVGHVNPNAIKWD